MGSKKNHDGKNDNKPGRNQAENEAQSPMSETIQHTAASAQVRDGTRIAYDLYKNPTISATSPRVVLIHSLAMDRNFWRPVAERLAHKAFVVSVDCRGHGTSDKPAGPYTAALFAQDINDLLESLGWGPALVAGASMGGCVALQFAADYPQRASALGLVDTSAWYGETAPKDWNARAERAVKEGLAGLIDFQVTRWFSEAFRSAHPDIVQQCVETFLRNDLPAYAATCRMLGAFDGRAALARLRLPTAVIVGEEDYAAPVAMAEVMHHGIAGSTLKVIAAARHLTPLETPDVIVAELSQLLERGAKA